MFACRWQTRWQIIIFVNLQPEKSVKIMPKMSQIGKLMKNWKKIVLPVKVLFTSIAVKQFYRFFYRSSRKKIYNTTERPKINITSPRLRIEHFFPQVPIGLDLDSVLPVPRRQPCPGRRPAQHSHFRDPTLIQLL